MPYIGNNHVVGDHVNNFKVLDDISSYTATFDGTATSIVSAANDTIRVPNHRFIQGQRVIYTHGGGSNIPGLSSASPYYVIFDTNNTFKLATSASNATSGTAVNITGVAGGGTSHTLNASFDGFNKKFKITHTAGKSARFTNPSQLNIAVNNVIQRPNLDANNFSEGFAIEHKEIIVFKTAPGASEVFWGNLIGETIESFDISDLKIDNFTGDGSTTEFTLSKVIPNNESIMVSLNGVLQHPTDNSTTRSYTVIANILSFTVAPGNGVEIQARHLGFAGAATGEVTGFYGRSGNVTLISSDNITTGDITSRNINSSGIITAASFSGPLNATSGSFSGDVSIGGTLTYEDVKNIDSVGIITARDGIEVTGGDIKVGSGVTIEGNGQATFTGIVTFGSNSTTIGDNVINVGTALTLGHTQGLQFHTQNLHSAGFEINQINASGIITAAQFSGDLVGNVRSGIGTALSSDVTSPLSDIFYTNNLLGIGATLTIDHPSSGAAAYTRYGDIRVDDTADLIIADGDDFIPDVLGLADFGTLGGGAAQGRIRVNTITNSAANGAPTVQNGLIISGITTFNDNVNLLDNDKLQIGTSQDLSIYHDGNHSYIDDTGTGNLKARSNNFRISNADESKISATFQAAAGVELFYDNVSRLSTASYGVAVNGNILLQEEIVHIGDTDTKIKFPSADNISFETAGSERLRIESGGDLRFNNADSIIHTSADTSRLRLFGGSSNSVNNGAALTLQGVNESGGNYADLASGSGGYIRFRTGTNERLRIASTGVVGIGTNDPTAGKLHIDGDVDTDLVMLDTYTAGNYAQVRSNNNAGIRIRGGGSYGGGMIDFGAGLRGTDPGVIKFHTGTDVTANNDERMRIQANGEIAMKSNGTLTDALASLHVQNGTFRVSQANGPTSEYFQVRTHTDASDGDLHLMSGVSGGIVRSYISKEGRIGGLHHHYAGATRTDAASPTNYYAHGAFGFYGYSGRTDDTTNYRSVAFMRAWDAGDNGDRNVIYYVNSDSDTTTADYDQHQKFGIKANGMAQFGSSVFAGRTESDETTPDSVYTGATGTTFIVYPNSGSYYSRMDARTTDNTDQVFKVDSGGGVVIKFQSNGDGRFDGGADIGSASDYAEYFEWEDGNPDSIDRRGITVVMDGEKIRPATDSDEISKIIGVVSAKPAVVGDSAWSEWQLAHLKDAYGSWVTKDEEYLVWNKFGTFTDTDGVKKDNPQPDIYDRNMASEYQILVSDIEKEKAAGRCPQAAIDQNLRVTKPSRVYNPDYDKTITYVPRSERKEWDAIGLVGKLVVRRGQPIGANWILMKSNVGTDPNDSNIILDKYLVR